MSISKIKTPALPLALGLIISSAIALQGGAAALAQGAADDASAGLTVQTSQGSRNVGEPQVGGVEILFAGDKNEAVPPQFAAMLPPPGTDAFHVGSSGGEGGGCGHHGMFSDANKLSDDQLERLYAIKEDLKDQMGLKMVQCHSLSRKLKDVLSASSIDVGAAHDLQAKITGLKTDMSNIKLDGLIKMAQVLTPEQRHELRLHMLRGALGHHGQHGHWGHSSHEHHEMMGK